MTVCLALACRTCAVAVMNPVNFDQDMFAKMRFIHEERNASQPLYAPEPEHEPVGSRVLPTPGRLCIATFAFSAGPECMFRA